MAAGCCWQFQCAPGGEAVQARGIDGLVPSQCPTTATQTLVSGTCSAQPPSNICGQSPGPPGPTPRPPNPGPSDTGCCWQYRCDPDGGVVNARSIPALTRGQCPDGPTQQFIPGQCSGTVPTTIDCVGPPNPGPGPKPPGPAPPVPPPVPTPVPPPGPSTGYDGVQLMVDLTQAIRKQFADTPGFLLSHAPQTPYLTLDPAIVPGLNLANPSYWGSYLSILAQLGPNMIDFLNIQAYNNCPWEDCPVGAQIVNNLLAASPIPNPLPPIYGSLKLPPLKPQQVAYGQLVPLTSPCANSKSPATTPWCAGTGDLNRGSGMMFWLNANGDGPIADGVVDAWFPPVSGTLSPPNRVVYYLNGPGTYSPPTTGYSRANTIILGFIYPAQNSGSSNSCPAGATSPKWACFGFYYSFGYGGEPLVLAGPSVNSLTYAQQLVAWRAVEPSKRKIMVGVGGAAATPLYSTWAENSNTTIVAAGLKQFFQQFETANGFALDGIDIDYEDSAALGYHPLPPQLGGAGLQMLPQHHMVMRYKKPVQFRHSPAGIATLCISAAILVLLVIALAVPAARNAPYIRNPAFAAPVTIAAALAIASIAVVATSTR